MGLLGWMAIELIVAVVTVSIAAGLLTTLANVAVIAAWPGATPVAKPCCPGTLLTVATEGGLEAHVTLPVNVCVLLSAKVPMATNGTATASGTLAVAGVTVTDTSGDEVTSTLAALLVIS